MHQEDRLYRTIGLTSGMFAQAQRWLERFEVPLRTLDSINLAAAASERATLVTADIQLHRAARALKIASKLLRA